MISKKLRIGWFSFTCCEDSTMMFIELMNTYFFEWKELIDFRYAKFLKKQNVIDEMDVAFVEGAITSDKEKKQLLEIRQKAKKLIAIGACAVSGMPSSQRNLFNEEQKKEIDAILVKFQFAEKVSKLEDLVQVDERVPGCPMDLSIFLRTLEKLFTEFNIKKESAHKDA